MLHVGIDLGGTAIKAGAVDENGRILARQEIPTGFERGAEDVLDRSRRSRVRWAPSRASGWARRAWSTTPAGACSPARTCTACRACRWWPVWRDDWGCCRPGVRLENDANAAALGESWLGRGRDERDFLLVTLGTGVGGGLILDGKLYAGPGGMAGEVGHVVIEPGGPLCGCGGHGCLETLASATAAARRAREAGLPRSNPGDLIELAARARAGAADERALCEAIGRDLGHGLALVVSLLDLRCFVIGGGFGAALDVLLPGVRAGLFERSYGERLAGVRVLRAELGADAGWIGAARLGMLHA